MHEVELVERVWRRVEGVLSLPEWRKELVAEVVQATLHALEVEILPDGELVTPEMMGELIASRVLLEQCEPKTTDYCKVCGESPDSGSHGPFADGHVYIPPWSTLVIPIPPTDPVADAAVAKAMSKRATGKKNRKLARKK